MKTPALAIAAATLALLAGRLLAAETAYPGRVWEPGPAEYGATIVDDVPVTMDDGVVLRASIAWPTDPATGERAPGRFPVIVEHTPYVALQAPVAPIRYLVERGYIYAVVRARGTGKSGGEIQYVSPRDGEDGRAIVDWAAHALDGTDGRVALVGCSYPGAMAMTGAAHVGPDSPLKAVVAGCNALVPQNRETFMLAGLMTYNMYGIAANITRLVGSTPSAHRFFHAMEADIEAGGPTAYDRDSWRDRQPLRLTRDIVDNGIPVLLWTGWHDVAETTVLRTYAAFQNAASGRPLQAPMRAGQPIDPRYQVIVGDWAHADGLDVGIYLQWLETWLKGVDTGIGHTRTPLHLFESGSERWINTAHFPEVPAYAPWYLGANGVLRPQAPGDGSTDVLRFGDADAPDGRLTFTTAPLAEGMTLAGPIGATLHAASSNRNLVLIARLYDVTADGSAREITKGAVLGSQSELDPNWSWTDDAGRTVWPWARRDRDIFLIPDQVYRFDVALAPRQWGVAPGHRLRFELITQNLPESCGDEPPQGVPGPDPCRLTRPQAETLPGGVYRILHGGDTPSVVNLPQLPWQFHASVPAAVLPTGWLEGQRRMVNDNPALPLDWGTRNP